MATSAGANGITIDVIPVVRDGQTCPLNTVASGQYKGKCEYGSYVGSVPNGHSGKCCFNNSQKKFLFSITGVGRTDSEYILDGRLCCPTGTDPTAALQRQGSWQCEYGSNTVGIPSANWLTKCCWDSTFSRFQVHLRDTVPSLTIPINKRITQHVIGKQEAGVDIHYVEVYGSHLALKATIWTDGMIHLWQDDTFDIKFSRDWNKAKNWYPGSFLTGHLSLDLLTKINDDRSVDIKLHITGTGLYFGRLEETVGPYHMDDPALKGPLAWITLC